MSDYTKSTNFASKDNLASGNPLKIVKGAEIDTEFNNIATAISTKADLASPTFTGAPLAPTASAGTNTTQVATTAFVNSAVDTTRIDVASASTVDLTTNAPNTRNINITGTTTITGFTVAAGKNYFVRFDGALTLTNNSSLVTQRGRNITTAAGDTCILRATAANTVEVLEYVSTVPEKQIQSITASVATNALTITLNPTRLDFRSSTLSSGTVNTRYVDTAISLTVPSGATLGTLSGQASRLTVIALDNSGTVELAVINATSSTLLDESTLLSTTALSTSSDFDNIAYSTTARTSVPFRIVGYVSSTQSLAGTWATAPSNIAGASDSLSASVYSFLASNGSLGVGQTWTDVSALRAANTTYTNNTGKPIVFMMSFGASSSSSELITLTVDGVAMNFINAPLVSGVVFGQNSAVIPKGSTYSYSANTGVSKKIYELL